MREIPKHGQLQDIGSSRSRHGLDVESALMAMAGVPMNRKNYLDLAYLGEVPNDLSAEELANLPSDLAGEARTPRRSPSGSGQ